LPARTPAKAVVIGGSGRKRSDLSAWRVRINQGSLTSYSRGLVSSEPLPEEKQLQMLLVLAVVNGLVADGSVVTDNAWLVWTWVASEAHGRGVGPATAAK